MEDGAALHFSRSVLPRSRPGTLHCHDFHELFWLQHGRARHHVNGTVEELDEGSVAFVRPDDIHGLQGRGDETHMVTLIFAPDLLEALVARHGGLAGRFFWSDAPLPATFARDSRQLADLSRAALRLETGARGTLEAEAFVLPLLADLMPTTGPLPDKAPDWLIEACAAARDPRVFRDGAAGFARAAGRAHAHVSRTARRFLGQSPSEYVNAIRMEHAARRLVGTGDSLSEIAAECGVPNLSHFHRLFRAHHGATPRAYRKKYQRDLIRPIPPRPAKDDAALEDMA